MYYGPNKLEIADVPEPTPTPGTVKVKVGFNGICGTDLHEYYAGPIFVPTEPHPLTGQQAPLTLGHEFSGVITDVGAGVTDYAAGDRVAIMPLYRCGHCGPCRAGNYNICQQIGFHGLMSDGSSAVSFSSSGTACGGVMRPLTMVRPKRSTTASSGGAALASSTASSQASRARPVSRTG